MGALTFSTDIGPLTTKNIPTLLQVLKVRKNPNLAGGLKDFPAKTRAMRGRSQASRNPGISPKKTDE